LIHDTLSQRNDEVSYRSGGDMLVKTIKTASNEIKTFGACLRDVMVGYFIAFAGKNLFMQKSVLRSALRFRKSTYA
jgi:hypothetical protein